MSNQPTTYSAIVAMASNRVIGNNGTLPWHIPEDLKFFKRTTLGHPIIMGRATYDSIGRPLPKRRNIILSKTLTEPPKGTELIQTPEALDTLDLGPQAFIIGGSQIYKLLLPRCQQVYLTYIKSPYEGDTTLPHFESQFPNTQTLESHKDYEFRLYTR